MNRMNIPGFVAEAALFETNRRYGGTVSAEDPGSRSRVSPQLGRPTGPHGPIGLPGQDCSGACWHVCMSFGRGFFDPCVTNCMKSCGQASLIRI